VLFSLHSPDFDEVRRAWPTSEAKWVIHLAERDEYFGRPRLTGLSPAVPATLVTTAARAAERSTLGV
jgi:hypothetical protein